MTPDFDAIIVGAGAGGGVAAEILCKNGWKVALIEKGRNPYPTLSAPTLGGSLFGNDEIHMQRYFGFQDPFIEPRVFNYNSGGASVAEAQGLGVCVGGGTVFYDGDSPRPTQADFRLLSTFGAVEGADVVDWPIAYSDLEPYLGYVEALIGVQGLDGGDPFAAPRSTPFPMPPGFAPKDALLLAAGARSLGYHPFPMAVAVNSMAYRGRPACANCGFCKDGCAINAKGSTAVTAVRDAMLTGNCTLLSECCVTKVNTEPSGEQVAGVSYIDANGAAQTLTATHVIVAVNAIETPRLLLASATSVHSAGLGNSSGRLGRDLMFHIVFQAVALFNQVTKSYRGRTNTHAFTDFTVSDGSPDYVRGGNCELNGGLHPIDEGTGYPTVACNALMKAGTFRNNMGVIAMMGEDMPQLINRVQLDPSVVDVYGRPAPLITYTRHAHDQAVIDRYMPKMADVCTAAGAVSVLQVDQAVQFGLPDTKHLMGTARMGTDPTISVTDPLGQVHDVQNLWIADGSLFPTSTAFNPTLTQQALAARQAAYLVNPNNPLSVIL